MKFSKVIIFIFISVLIFSSCSITLPNLKFAKKEITSDTTNHKGFNFTEALDELIKTGLGKTYEDFENVSFAFTVRDTLKTPLSFVPIIIDFGEIGRLRFGWTDENGMFELAFTRQLLDLKPKLLVEGYPDANFEINMSASISDTNNKPLRTYELSSLHRKEYFNDLVIYSPDIDSIWITNGQTILDLERKFINNFLGLDPILWGIALINTTDDNVAISPSTINFNNKPLHIFPFPISDGITKIAATNLHEWIESSLDYYYNIPNNRLPRWMRDGLAQVSMIEFYKWLPRNNKKDLLSADKKWLNAQISGGKKLCKEYTNKGKSYYPLLSWQDAGPDYSILNPSQPFGYSAASSLWFEISNKYGFQVIPAILSQLNKNNINNKTVLEVLSKNCPGEDWNALIENYPVSKIVNFIDESGKILQK